MAWTDIFDDVMGGLDEHCAPLIELLEKNYQWLIVTCIVVAVLIVLAINIFGISIMNSIK